MTIDPFATLTLPRRFALDLKDAEARHRDLSSALHPDRHVGKSPAERRAALSRAIEVNEAWRAVRDPIRRAEAILAAEGLGDQVGETREPKPSPDFLMEVMEARERLEEAKSARSMDALNGVLREARQQWDSTQRELARAIDGALDVGGGRDRLASAIPLLGRLRYAARFLEEAQNALDELEGI